MHLTDCHNRCAGTVYADPYPGFVHGVTPAICKHGCEPTLAKDLGETDEQRLWREAHEFMDQYASEMGLSDEARPLPPAYCSCCSHAAAAERLRPRGRASAVAALRKRMHASAMHV